MEHVFVVDRARLFDGQVHHGFLSALTEPERTRQLAERIRQYGYFAPRSSVENDPSRKQIIPYSIVTDGPRVLLLKRLSGGAEKRLHDLYSVGVGGHINRIDEVSSEGDVLLGGARRELDEEISLAAGATMEIVGFVNDDSNPVGSVHFGVIFRVSCMDQEPTIRETNQLEGRMVFWHEAMSFLDREPDSFETWSRIVLNGWSAATKRLTDET